jgi:hypothetical protein
MLIYINDNILIKEAQDFRTWKVQFRWIPH